MSRDQGSRRPMGRLFDAVQRPSGLFVPRAVDYVQNQPEEDQDKPKVKISDRKFLKPKTVHSRDLSSDPNFSKNRRVKNITRAKSRAMHRKRKIHGRQ